MNGDPLLRVFRIKLPLRIKTSKKKKQALNLNVYRNLHFRSLSSQKNKFFRIAEKLLKRIPPLGVITLHYTVFLSSKRRLDIMNVGSIVDKYFSDTMTEVGIIEDDDYTHITDIGFSFGGIVKEEYILVTITETKRKEATPMRVLLDQNDVQIALTNYVDSLNIPNATGAFLKIVNDEVEAEVTFDENDSPIASASMTDEAPKEEASKPKRTRRTRAQIDADEAAAKEAVNVDETVSDGADNSSTGDTDSTEAEDSTPDPEVTEEAPKSNSSKNLFGDKENPSSEDDGADTTAPSDTPAPIVTKPKGSIFDS